MLFNKRKILRAISIGMLCLFIFNNTSHDASLNSPHIYKSHNDNLAIAAKWDDILSPEKGDKGIIHVALQAALEALYQRDNRLFSSLDYFKYCVAKADESLFNLPAGLQFLFQETTSIKPGLYSAKCRLTGTLAHPFRQKTYYVVFGKDKKISGENGISLKVCTVEEYKLKRSLAQADVAESFAEKTAFDEEDYQFIYQLRSQVEARKGEISTAQKRAMTNLDGLSVAREITNLFEFAVTGIMNKYAASHKNNLALLGYGSFARKEMLTHSDTDFILIWRDTEIDNELDKTIQEILKLVGLGRHAVRFHAWNTVDECVSKGHVSVTDIDKIEGARLIWGSEALFEDVKRRSRLKASHPIDVLIQRFLISELLFGRLSEPCKEEEPNLKFSKGYLRDILDKIYRLGIYQGKDLTSFLLEDNLELLEQKGIITAEEREDIMKAASFLLLVRDTLHLYKGEEIDVIDQESQTKIARQLGMKDGNELLDELKKHSQRIVDISERLWGFTLDYYAERKESGWKKRIMWVKAEVAKLDTSAQKTFATDENPSIALLATWYTEESEVLDWAWKRISQRPLSEFNFLDWSILAAITNNLYTSPAALQAIVEKIPIAESGLPEPEWEFIATCIKKHPSATGSLIEQLSSVERNAVKTKPIEDEINGLLKEARLAGLEIPTNAYNRYKLIAPFEFFGNDDREFNVHKFLYGDRFYLDYVSDRDKTRYIDKVLVSAKEFEDRTIALVPDDTTVEDLERLNQAGVRFIRVNLDTLLHARTEEKGYKHILRFQKNTYTVMLLARRIDEINPESSIYRILSFFIKTHFDLKDVEVSDYIKAIIDNQVAVLINGILAFRPAEAYDIPEYYEIAPALTSA